MLKNNEFGQSIKIASELELPVDYITEIDFISGIRGYGKSYCVNVIEEQFLMNNWPFVVIDPMGIHYSIRQHFDNIVIIGGKEGDYDNYALAAGCIASKLNVIVDLSEEDTDYQREICRIILESIRDIRIEEKCPIKIIIEECDIFIPQRSGDRECKETIKWLVRKGRMYGIGMSLICQRYASVDKEVVTQVDNFLMFRTTYSNDLDNIKKIVDAGGVKLLKSASKGQCLVHSPYYEGIVNINQMTCKHLGTTPKLGVEEEEIELKELNDEYARVMDYCSDYVGDNGFLSKLKARFL